MMFDENTRKFCKKKRIIAKEVEISGMKTLVSFLASITGVASSVTFIFGGNV